MTRRLPVAVLISGRGSNMRSLAQAACDPTCPYEIVLVVSNRPDAAGLAVAAGEFGLITSVVDHRAHAGRESFEEALDDVIRASGAELVVLAGFLRVLTPFFVTRWQGRLVNIHPSLLPSFRGLHTHVRALTEGVRIHGCTVHYVVPELDAGPILAQAAVPVLPDDDETRLAARVLAAEHVLFPRAIEAIARGRVRLEQGRVIHDRVDADAGAILFCPAQEAR